MTTFISIILLVFCILQIILFFKVWRMTNNVKKSKTNSTKTIFQPKIYMKKQTL